MTQAQKILYVMLAQSGHDWWLPMDFMQPNMGDLFVGYEASARLSELGLHTYMIESRREGKYMARRFRFENIEEVLRKSPDADFIRETCIALHIPTVNRETQMALPI